MFLTRGRAKSKLWKPARVLAGVLLSLLLIHPGESRADLWQWLTDLVEEPGDIENAALAGVALPPNAIVTHRGETRTIQLGRDLIMLHPSTAVTIDVAGKKTSVQVLTGTIRAKVAKRKKKETFHFRTLTLVGTVKGTEFEVSVMRDASAVSVYEGRVAVKAVGQIGGMDVTAGKTATVTRGDHEPNLGKTPAGGAAAAAKAVARQASKHAAEPDDDPFGERDNQNKAADRGTSSSGRPSSSGGSGGAGSGSSGGSDSDSGGDSDGGDSDGEGGDGDGGDGDDD
jgi:ferric-dicitrate binding protein FerR (iron transport regulator)